MEKTQEKKKEVCWICGGTKLDKRTIPATECECIEEEKNGI